MKKKFLVLVSLTASALLVALTVNALLTRTARAAIGPVPDTNSDDIDSLGCGDGTTTVPNEWFVQINRNDPNMFQETALLSVNLFSIRSVSGDISSQDNGTVGLIDVNKIPDVIYSVTFQPGVDTPAFPTSHVDTIRNRNQALLQLKSLGATVTCSHVMHPRF